MADASGFLIVLDRDLSEEGAERVADALRMVRGVIDVQPVPADSSIAIAEMRANTKLRQKLYDLAKDL